MLIFRVCQFSILDSSLINKVNTSIAYAAYSLPLPLPRSLSLYLSYSMSISLQFYVHYTLPLFQALTRAAYNSLGLQTYFTAGPTETKAWTIKRGMTAPQVLTPPSTYNSICALSVVFITFCCFNMNNFFSVFYL